MELALYRYWSHYVNDVMISNPHHDRGTIKHIMPHSFAASKHAHIHSYTLSSGLACVWIVRCGLQRGEKSIFHAFLWTANVPNLVQSPKRFIVNVRNSTHCLWAVFHITFFLVCSIYSSKNIFQYYMDRVEITSMYN